MLTELDEIWQRSAVAWNTFVDALVSPGKQKRLFFFSKYLKVPELHLYTSPQTWWQSATAGRARVKNWYEGRSKSFAIWHDNVKMSMQGMHQ